MDGDDLLTDGALAAVASRLAVTEPDVLLIGFARLEPSGAVEPNAWRHLLGESHSGQVFTLRDRPDAIRLTMTCWSKVIRRAFLTGLAFRFEPGIHEDVPFTWAVLMNATRIATLDRVCYLYRQRRGGALTAAPTRDNFQIFARYEKVFAAIGFRPADLSVSGRSYPTAPSGRRLLDTAAAGRDILAASRPILPGAIRLGQI
ncbi:MAG: hypothetical protein ACM3ML_33745 [Micromonosporaceae bacterium]